MDPDFEFDEEAAFCYHMEHGRHRQPERDLSEIDKAALQIFWLIIVPMLLVCGVLSIIQMIATR